MFTGIIEDLGKIVETGNNQLKISTYLDSIGIGDSVAVNGVCLTVTETDSKHGNTCFVVDVSEETHKKTNLSQLKLGTPVNLERSLPSNGRFGGHFVTGHVECTGKIVAIATQNKSKIFRFSYPAEYDKHIVSKGSVAVDGISLTIIEVKKHGFTVSVIPHTLKNTTLGFKKSGDTVNIETDIISKYVEKLVNPKKLGITREMLEKAGF